MCRPRRRLFIALSLLACVLVGGVVAWLLWRPASAITRENAAKIAQGMTAADVEAIFGGPARDDRTGPVEIDSSDPSFLLWLAMGPRLRSTTLWDLNQQGIPIIRTWQSDNTMVLVHFDDTQRVVEAEVIPMHRTSEGPLTTVRRWLGL